MAKLTLSDIANALNDTSTVNTINANSALIETALENTLSRDGTTPNTMSASLDMNNNRVINLPAPISNTEPLRLADVNSIGALSTPSVYVQSSVPDNSAEGSLWIDSDSTDIDLYQFTESAWTDTGVNLKGATGDTGAPGAGSGDVTGQSSSVDSEIALFSGTGGKTIKRASSTGILKATSGVIGTATSGTDYAPATSGSSILRGDGSGGFSAVSTVGLTEGGTGQSSAAASFSALKQAATTSATGVVELATDGETTALSSSSVVVTPSNLTALAASTTQRGITRFATGAETITGTDATIAVTPSSLTSKTSSTSAVGLIRQATSAEILSDAASVAMTPANVAATQAVSSVAFSASMPALDFGAARNFDIATVTANITSFPAPTNLAVGQRGFIRLLKGTGTTAYTIAFNTVWKFPGGTRPTMPATASSYLVIEYFVFATNFISCSFGSGMA